MQFTDSPAYDLVLADDRKYHIVFLVIGGLFLLLLLAFTGYAGRRWRQAPRRIYRGFAVAAVLLDLFLVVAMWANVTSVANPHETLAGTTFSPVGQAWLASGSTVLTPALQHAIDARLAWQRPKAVICAVLLVALVMLTAWLWRRLTAGRPWMLAATILAAAAGVLLMLMVIGNAEGAIAPLTLTVIYG